MVSVIQKTDDMHRFLKTIKDLRKLLKESDRRVKKERNSYGKNIPHPILFSIFLFVVDRDDPIIKLNLCLVCKNWVNFLYSSSLAKILFPSETEYCLWIMSNSSTLPKIIRLNHRLDKKINIGRIKENVNIVLDSYVYPHVVSELHASLLWCKTKKTWILKDENSCNGILVNYVKLKNRVLEVGDIITFGAVYDLKFGESFRDFNYDCHYRFALVRELRKQFKKRWREKIKS